MILVVLPAAAALGWFTRPRTMTLAITAACVATGTVLWFVAAHDDGEPVEFVAAIAALTAVCLATGWLAGAARRRRVRRTAG